MRRLMRQECLVVARARRRRYGSYQGEISPAPDNFINRDFQAVAPNEKWLTDITEFQIAAGKVYLSPMIDCFVIARRIPFLLKFEVAPKIAAVALHWWCALKPVKWTPCKSRIHRPSSLQNAGTARPSNASSWNLLSNPALRWLAFRWSTASMPTWCSSGGAPSASANVPQALSVKLCSCQ